MVGAKRTAVNRERFARDFIRRAPGSKTLLRGEPASPLLSRAPTRYHTLSAVPDDESSVETTKQRVDRELNELLGELRIALPGVQMLFAFLLTVSFYARFETLRGLFRAVFFGTFICTTVAAVCLIAPSSNHRISFRARDKERLLLRANRFAIAGMPIRARRRDAFFRPALRRRREEEVPGEA
jgi:hypothetical protein